MGDNSNAIVSQPSVFALGVKFPLRLHLLLDGAEKGGFSNIVSWLDDGKSFKIHQRQKFISDILPVYFANVAYKSFQRKC